MTTVSVQLAATPNEMAQEEIRKQLAFLARDIQNVRFSAEGNRIDFDAPADSGATLGREAQALATRIERALRHVQRKVVYRSSTVEYPPLAEHVPIAGVHFLGTGQVALSAVPLRLFRYFDRVFEEFGTPWMARALMTPTLIPDRVLARCEYFRSFPQYVTFASHLKEDVHIIDGFRARHLAAEKLDDLAVTDMDRPEACLSPAVCYHVYHVHQDSVMPPSGTVYGICGKCFRFESSNISDMRRLWDFTMREVVFLGGRDEVLKAREKSIEMMADFLERHCLAGEIRTASDPFFVAPDAVSKSYFQLSSDAKFEVSLMLPAGERTAAGSHNYHADFFGRAFNISLEGGGLMHSVCVAFGIERWVYAFLQQHGSDPRRWPDAVRGASEFQGVI